MIIKTKHKDASLATNEKGEKVIRIDFPYNLDDLEFVRSLPGRKFHQSDRCWSVPIYKETISLLIDQGFILDDSLQKIYKDFRTNKEQLTQYNSIPGLKGNLYEFQREGVAFIEATNGRTLVADEMGLGKTIQVLSWLQLHPELRPVVIVTPASLKLNWEREAKKWMQMPHVQILSGEDTYSIRGNIVIINYDILKVWSPRIKAIEPKVLVTDESHYYKSNKAKRTKAVKRLAKGIPHVIALSGTPIVNRPIEIYNAVSMIDPTIFPNYEFFKSQYCNPKYNGFGWTYNGGTHMDELHSKLIGTVMIRRLKKDVLKDLPPKTRSFIPLSIHNRTDYQSAEKNFISFVRNQKGIEAAKRASNAEGLTKIEGLKQIAVEGKLTGAMEWIEDFLEVEDKLVVFAVHRATIERLMQKFGKEAVKIDGSVSMTERQRVVDEFQVNPKIKLIVLQIKAGGVGWNLTKASNVAFIELPWSPGDLVQAEDRVHRITQKNAVTIYFLMAINTIEEKIAGMLDAKQSVLDGVLDGKEYSDQSILSEIYKSYQNE